MKTKKLATAISIILALALLIPFSSAALSDSLKYYYKLDVDSATQTNALNLSANATLTNYGAEHYFTNLAKHNGGYNITAVTDDSGIDSTQGITLDENFTTSIWIKANNWSPMGLDSVVFLKNLEGNTFLLGQNEGLLSLLVRNGGSWDVTSVAFDEASFNDQWVLFTYVKRLNNHRVYVNDTLFIERNFSGSGTRNGFPEMCYMAGNGGDSSPCIGGGSKFNATYDEAGYWQRALNNSEISSLWNSSNGIFYPFTESSESFGLPNITSFATNASSILNGSSARLSWNITDATNATINNGIGAISFNNNTIVSPITTTTYTLNATNENGSTTAQVTITVNYPSLPVIEDFSSNASSILNGSSARLSWNVSNATTVTLSPAIGIVSLNDNITVSPTVTTNYTLNATSINGTVTSEQIIIVVYASVPIITNFSTNTSTILNGSSIRLSWNVSNATTVTLSPAIGIVSLNDNITVSPTINTTYTLNASSANGSMTQQITITVNYPAPPCTPNYYCSSFATCNINNTEECNTVSDSNLCGIQYGGNNSDYNQACTFSSFTYGESDVAPSIIDSIIKVIVGIGLFGILIGLFAGATVAVVLWKKFKN